MKIGNLTFSNFTKENVALIRVNANNLDSTPFFIGMPYKGFSAVYWTVLRLTEFLRNDLHSDNHDLAIKKLRRGDKVLFFKSVIGKFQSFNNGILKVGFAQRQDLGYGTETIIAYHKLKNLYAPYATAYEGRKSKLNTIKDFYKKARSVRGEVRDIDRILLGEKEAENVRVPSGKLRSKILLVAGDGHLMKFRNELKQLKPYERSISEIFPDNIRVEKNLEILGEYYSKNNIELRGKFRDYYKPRLEELKALLPDFSEELSTIQRKWDKDIFSVTILKDLTRAISRNGNDIPPLLEEIAKAIKKFKNPLPDNLRMIVLNSPLDYYNYKNSLEYLAKKGVHVVIAFGLKDIEDLTNHNLIPQHAFFWTRDKLRNMNLSRSEGNVDYVLEEKANNYLRQKINVKIYDDKDLSHLYWNVYSHVKELEGYEYLKEFFWKTLFPVYHVYKNSPGFCDSAFNYDVVKGTFDIYEEKKASFPNKVKLLIDQFYTHVLELRNLKDYLPGLYLQQSCVLMDSQVKFPEASYQGIAFTDKITDKTKRIALTGLPFEDHKIRLMDKLLNEWIVPDITILCWPREAKKLKSLQKRRANTDWTGSDVLEVTFEDHTGKLNVEAGSGNENDQYDLFEQNSWELELEKLGESYQNYYHRKYESGDSVLAKQCKTVHLKTGDWIYLPVDDQVHVFDKDSHSVVDAGISELVKGDLLIVFNLSREDVRATCEESPKLKNAFDILEIWSEGLRQLFKEYGKNYLRLELALNKICSEHGIAGNPAEYNLRRWLNDADLTLTPRDNNLKMILTAISALNKLQDIKLASQKIRSHQKRLRKFIKEQVIQRSSAFLKGHDGVFSESITVHGVEVQVQTAEVLDVEKGSLDIDFNYVNRIISNKC